MSFGSPFSIDNFNPHGISVGPPKPPIAGKPRIEQLASQGVCMSFQAHAPQSVEKTLDKLRRHRFRKGEIVDMEALEAEYIRQQAEFDAKIQRIKEECAAK